MTESEVGAAASWAQGQDLAALVAGARDAERDWPGVRVSPQRLADHIRARWEAATDAGRTAERVRELYLACACADGVPAALRVFDAEILGAATAALRRMRQGDDFVDEALQRAREHLLVAPHGGRPRIEGYGGVGNLSGWTRVVVVRLALQMIRERDGADDDDVAERADPSAPDVQRQQVQGEHGDWLKRCVEETLGALSAEDRAILDLLFRERLSMSEVGERLGVNKSTVSRRVAAIRGEVFDQLKLRARADLQIGGTEYASLVRDLRSHLDITLGVLGPR